MCRWLVERGNSGRSCAIFAGADPRLKIDKAIPPLLQWVAARPVSDVGRLDDTFGASDPASLPFARTVASYRESHPEFPALEPTPAREGVSPWQVGPLEVFAAACHHPRSAILLGGDLHASPPSGEPRRDVGGRGEDGSLDRARISVVAPRFDICAEVGAVEGVWLLPLTPRLSSAELSVLFIDAESRVRAWLLLPSPDSIIGMGSDWLPALPHESRGG